MAGAKALFVDETSEKQSAFGGPSRNRRDLPDPK
jgi:hypothetical protein